MCVRWGGWLVLDNGFCCCMYAKVQASKTLSAAQVITGRNNMFLLRYFFFYIMLQEQPQNLQPQKVWIVWINYTTSRPSQLPLLHKTPWQCSLLCVNIIGCVRGPHFLTAPIPTYNRHMIQIQTFQPQILVKSKFEFEKCWEEVINWALLCWSNCICQQPEDADVQTS